MKIKDFYTSPLAGFIICRIDEPTYFGYMNIFGNWIIMKVQNTVVQYVYGESDFDTNWNNRSNLTYKDPNEAFVNLTR